MPKYEQVVPVPGCDSETILAIGVSAFKALGWDLQFAGPQAISGATIGSWKTYAQQILVQADENGYTITSEMVRGESMDLYKKNNKNVVAFIDAFDDAKASITDAENQANLEELQRLRILTEKTAEQESAEAAAVNKAMNLAGSNLYLTYGIIAINVIVFILMVMNGAGIMDPNGLVHIKWGSNYMPLTLTGDWWRLISCQFIHFGVIHLIMNLYALYTVAVYLEPMLGKLRFLTAYLCTGVFASLASLWWHKEGVNSAGASGAVFGLYGVFLALLTTSLIPAAVRKALLQSIVVFVIFNLIYGMKGGIDNAAHMGGLLSGLIFGYAYALVIKKERTSAPLKWVAVVFILITAGCSYLYLDANKLDSKQRAAAENKLKNDGSPDADKYYANMEAFGKLEKEALDAYSDSTLSSEQKVKVIDSISLPAFKKAAGIIQETQAYSISPAMKNRLRLLESYTGYRVKEMELFRIVYVAPESPVDVAAEIEVVQKNINTVIDSLNNLQ